MREINWHEWGDAAFEESKRTGKPVLLSISAVWCHWCHVMDHTTYSDPVVVNLINEKVVPIRVDHDRNPDINARYNMGGWPSTVFLTHERDVITGATYIPPEQMVVMLNRVLVACRDEGEELVARAKVMTEDVHSRVGSARMGRFALEDVEHVLQSVRSSYDPQHGGFGAEQKFPFANVLDLLILSYEASGNDYDLGIVTHTLRSMLRGQIFDPEEGGMFRYTTRPEWTVPHYEKMLEDNAMIASTLLDAYRLSGEEEFALGARGVFDYAERVLLDPGSGTYRGSQDAYEEYYLRDMVSRKRLSAPRVDSASYTDSNCLMARSLLKRWGVAKERSAKERALGAVSFFNSLPRGRDGTVCHYYEDGSSHGFGHLRDQVCLAMANLECYEATGDSVYLDHAHRAVELLSPMFGTPDGGLFDVSAQLAIERGLNRFSVPLASNASAAICLAKLAGITGDESHRASAQAVLNAVAGQFRDYGILAADYAIAVSIMAHDPLVVTVGARAGDQFLQEAIGACNGACAVRLDESGEGVEAGAVVCTGARCLSRTTVPGELPGLIVEAMRTQWAI